jgi:glycosyltransferase involved in cell wall biosynthesis
LIVTEHGIYTNERRIELSAADWLYDSGASGFSIRDRVPELRDLWLNAFSNFSRIAYNLSNVITTQYRVNQEFQLKDGAPEHKMQIIPNGIDVDQFAPIESQGAPRRPRILLVGRIVPIKDIRTYILAAAILKQLVPDIEAVIIGPDDEDPAYANDCRMLVKQHQLEGVVKFLGRVPDIGEQFRRSDVIVLTSISEAQPLAILEGGAAGLPAVTTDVGSCREVVEGDPNDPAQEAGGFVVPTCDPPAVAEAVARLLQDPVLRHRMGQALRARVRATYNQKRIRRLYEALYMSQLDGRERAAFEEI